MFGPFCFTADSGTIASSLCRASRGPYFNVLQVSFEFVVTVRKAAVVNCFLCPADSVTDKNIPLSAYRNLAGDNTTKTSGTCMFCF
jgi:hypothetical protein